MKRGAGFPFKAVVFCAVIGLTGCPFGLPGQKGAPDDSMTARALRAPTVLWVDFSYTGSDSDGTEGRPYLNLTQAMNAAVSGDTIRIKGGSSTTSSPECVRITQPVRIEASGGAVAVGDGSVNAMAPNVVNMTQAAAQAAITAAGLTPGTVSGQYHDTVPAGRVISQNPIAGRIVALGSAVALAVSNGPAPPTPTDLMFIHHSVGGNWLEDGLRTALVAKSYVTEVNEITYGTDVAPDSGRPDSLDQYDWAVPGDFTDMGDWIYWFNDYLDGVLAHDQAGKAVVNRIVMFKSCYPNSAIWDDGTPPGDPFSGERTLADYKAVFRHPSGPGNTYVNGSTTYQALEDIFAANPNTLFVPVVLPPLSYGPPDSTNDAEAHRARLFVNWLKNDWLTSYRTRTGLDNVAVFDMFNILAYPDNHATHPNRLRAEYHASPGDSHPNLAGNTALTQQFATGVGNFLDAAWTAFSSK